MYKIEALSLIILWLNDIYMIFNFQASKEQINKFLQSCNISSIDEVCSLTRFL
jgi:hypothetical protein